MPQLRINRSRGQQPLPVPAAGGSVVHVSPGSSISSAITTAGVGGTVVLRNLSGGYHRITAGITPLASQTILGEQGAILSGLVTIAGPWTVSGSQWWATAQLPGTDTHTAATCVSGWDCGPREDVFRDGVLLQRVTSQAAATAGKFFPDYAANRVYVGDDPTGHTIEQAVSLTGIGGSASGVTLRNLIVEGIADDNQKAAINCQGTGWLIEYCELRRNHFGGITSDKAVTIRHCYLHHNGSVGAKGFLYDGGQVTNNEMAYNNIGGFSDGWEAGGIKMVRITNQLVAGNYSHDNNACGLWWDDRNQGIECVGNIIEWNQHHGIHHEISLGSHFQWNRIRYNADHGITLNCSQDSTVEDNEFENNGWSASGSDVADMKVQQENRVEGVSTGMNNTLRRNKVTHTLGAGRASTLRYFSGDTAALTNNAWTDNDYLVNNTSRSDLFFYNSAQEAWSAWQGHSKDTTASGSTITQVAAPLLYNNAEGGAAGATPTTTDTGSVDAFTTITAQNTSTLTHDTTRARRGYKSYKITPAATSATFLEWGSTKLGTLTEAWARDYIYLPTGSLAGSMGVFRLLSTGSQCMRVHINTARKFQIFNAANTSVFQSTVNLPFDQWIRFEYHVVASTTVGLVEVKAWWTDVEGLGTPDDQSNLTATLVLLASFNTARFGQTDATGGTPPLANWFDDPAVSTAGWLGPV